MVVSQKRSNKKPTGGAYKKLRKKQKCHSGSVPTHTKLEKTTRKNIRVLGGNIKTRLFTEEFANVTDSKTKTTKKVKIKSVVENPANRHYVRRNILTKGTVIETEMGKAKITSRPAQTGVVNAVLM